jgi:predicted dehydrogenase
LTPIARTSVERMERINIAVVGCGGISELVHLPVLAASGGVRITALVDPALDRARRLADRYRVEHVVGDYRAIVGKADAAILALPHHLHGAVTTDLLKQGIHVLIEKPMALTSRDCDGMIAAAAESERVLAVGLVRRFYDSSRMVLDLLAAGLLGRIVSFEWREGAEFRYGPASDFMFRKETAGGGILVSLGVHVLDLILWWFGDCASVEYRDDAMGGVETDCELRMTMASGVTGRVEMSWTRNLNNTCRILGENGTLEVATGPYKPVVSIQLKGEEFVWRGEPGRATEPDPTFCDIYGRQLDDFLLAIRHGRSPLVSGREGRRSVELIERCYASRRFWELPWAICGAG